MDDQDRDPITKLAQEQLDNRDQYPKSVAQYRPAEKEDERCADCEYFNGEGSTRTCSKVEGEINPGFTCNLFEAHDEEAEAEGAHEDEDKTEEGDQ